MTTIHTLGKIRGLVSKIIDTLLIKIIPQIHSAMRYEELKCLDFEMNKIFPGQSKLAHQEVKPIAWPTEVQGTGGLH